MSEQEPAEQESVRPLLRVVRGEPDEVELAALTAVVAAAASGGGEPEPPRRTSHWADRARGLRQPLYPGPQGWRRSTFPR